MVFFDIQPQSSLTSSTEQILHVVNSTVYGFYTSLLFLSFSLPSSYAQTLIKPPSTSKTRSMYPIVENRHPSTHSRLSHLHTIANNLAGLKNITLACTNVYPILKAEILNVCHAGSFSSLKVIAGTFHVQELFDIIRDSNVDATLFLSQIFFIQGCRMVANGIVCCKNRNI